MLIQWEKYFFTVNDIYGALRYDTQILKADVHCYFQQSHFIEVDKKTSLHKKNKTLCIDLTLPEEQLRKDMNRTTRYQINKAGRDQLSVQHIEAPTREDVLAFIAFFNPFAAAKGIEACREDKVEALRKNNRLVISHVFHQHGQKLASHLYITDGKRATMLYSCSGRFAENDIEPIAIGRANRFLHWQDMIFFKQKAYQVYDFLGLSLDVHNKEQQNINKFKKGFGGREEIHYQSYVPQTKKGMLLIFLLRWKWRNQMELVKRSTALKENQARVRNEHLTN